jgi:type IX secretion system substrate protein
MRRFLFYTITGLFIGFSMPLFSQITAAGDIAFTAVNVDGDDDFGIVTLVDISANTTVYFTDKNWDGLSAFTGTEGILQWDSGSAVIKAGTVIVFTDVDSNSNPYYGVSVGSLTTPDAGFNLSGSGETLLAYLGSDLNTPSTFLAGVKNATLTAGELNNTGLTAGTNFLEFNPTASPDGGYFSASRSDQTAYANYLTIINNKANWTRNTSDGEATLPISTTGFTISATNWTGTTNTDWNTAGNWDNGIPDNSFQVVIPNVTNQPIIASGTNYIIGNLTIDTGSSLSINTAKGLTVSGDLTNNGTLTIDSDAATSGSLIVTGSSTGNITYKRYMTGVDKWHLISAPVGGQDINTFVTTGSNNVGLSGVNYSLTPYDNTVAKGASGVWNHWTTDGSGAGNISGAGSFVAGKGYEVLRTADGTMAFTGTVTTAQVSIAVTNPASNNAWNLIGNPFPSAIFANSSADATNNFISQNTAALDASYQALYLWNPGSSSYDLINQATGATYIAPGQGFFVKSLNTGATVNFTTAMRTHQSAVAFQKSNTSVPSIRLKVDDGTTTKTTDIKYMAGKTLGLDPGYDAGLFDASTPNFSLYTKLVEDNGVNFRLQVLPDSIYDTLVIPIGLVADAGSHMTFNAAISDLPAGKKVYLEDRVLNSFNEINSTDKSYVVVLSSQSQGADRFYLRTLDNLATLVSPEFNVLQISIIARPKRHTIRILGDIKGTARLVIYDMLGRTMFSEEFQGALDNEINVSPMTQGIYIVKVQSAKGNYSTKIAWY